MRQETANAPSAVSSQPSAWRVRAAEGSSPTALVCLLSPTLFEGCTTARAPLNLSAHSFAEPHGRGRKLPGDAPAQGAGQLLYDRRGDRPRRDGRRVPGAGRAPEAPGGGEGAPARARLPRGDPHPVPARGGDRRSALPPAHRADS